MFLIAMGDRSSGTRCLSYYVMYSTVSLHVQVLPYCELCDLNLATSYNEFNFFLTSS